MVEGGKMEEIIRHMLARVEPALAHGGRMKMGLVATSSGKA